MLLSAVSILVVAQSSSEIPEGLTNNPVIKCNCIYRPNSKVPCDSFNVTYIQSIFLSGDLYRKKLDDITDMVYKGKFILVSICNIVC